MSESIKIENETGAVRKEDGRLGYQVAVDLWTYQGKINWDRYNVMLVANSIIAALIGVVFPSHHQFPGLMIVLAVAALLLCLCWVLVTARGFDHHTYWGFCAWELEKLYLSSTVTTVFSLPRRNATCIAAHAAAPDEMPARMPSSRARRRVVSAAALSATCMT